MTDKERDLQDFAESLRKFSEETFGTPEQAYTANRIYFEIARTRRNSLALFDCYFELCEADITDWQRERIYEYLCSKIDD